MPRYRRSFRPRGPRKASIQHSPSTMEQSFLSNVGAEIYAVTPNVNAGGSLAIDRLDTDRLTDCANGSKIGKVTFTLTLEPAPGIIGTIEFMVFRVERQFVVPILGTNPLPTNAEIAGSGLQQTMRQNLPGWCMKFGGFPVTAEVAQIRNIVVSPSRMGMPAMRDGDYLGIVIFNRTNGSIGYSMQMRYRSYR